MTQSTLMIEELDDCFVKTAANIMQYYVDEKERNEVLEQLRDAVKGNSIESARMKIANEIKEQLANESECNLECNLKDIVKKYKKAISEIKVDISKDRRLAVYDHQVQGLSQVSETTPSKGPDDTDTDLRLTGTDINVIDPISKMRMTDPVRNAICGHIYDRESLMAMLQKNNKTRCPVVGCTSTDYINLSQCRTDIVTKLYLDKNPA